MDGFGFARDWNDYDPNDLQQLSLIELILAVRAGVYPAWVELGVRLGVPPDGQPGPIATYVIAYVGPDDGMPIVRVVLQEAWDRREDLPYDSAAGAVRWVLELATKRLKAWSREQASLSTLMAAAKKNAPGARERLGRMVATRLSKQRVPYACDVEDAVQETIFRLLRKLPEFEVLRDERSESSCWRWVQTTFRNVCSEMRKQAKPPTIHLPPTHDDPLHERNGSDADRTADESVPPFGRNPIKDVEDIVSPQPGSEVQAANHDQVVHFLAFLDARLKGKNRDLDLAVFDLRRLRGYSWTHLTKTLLVTRDQVKNSIYRVTRIMIEYRKHQDCGGHARPRSEGTCNRLGDRSNEHS